MRDAGYATRFNNLLRHTNEKYKTFTVLKQNLKPGKKESLMDVGCGFGDLAIPLSNFYEKVVAIDNNDFIKDKAPLPENLIFKEIDLFSFETDEKFDSILMSFIWDSIPKSRWKEVIDKYGSYLKPKGKLAIVSYERNCGWTDFMEHFSEKLGHKMTGYIGDVTKLLDSFKKVDFETKIVTADSQALYEVCSFFFNNSPAYNWHETEIKQYLKRFKKGKSCILNCLQSLIIKEKN